MRVLKWALVVGSAFVIMARAVTFFGPPGLVPSMLGTGGFVQKTISEAPHPFVFDRPRLWNDSTDELRRSGRVWDVLILGPQTEVGVIFTTLFMSIRPDAVHNIEYPVPGGPFESLDSFADRILPYGWKGISATATIVDSRPARDRIYDYVFYDAGNGAWPVGVHCRGRAVIFEDRGYYYMISIGTRDAEYDRYVEVFDRAIKSFRFMD